MFNKKKPQPRVSILKTQEAFKKMKAYEAEAEGWEKKIKAEPVFEINAAIAWRKYENAKHDYEVLRAALVDQEAGTDKTLEYCVW